jgi:flavin reductase (DIM6/NTAB) family NADH-FMN oxidoreductase RutF
VLAAHQELASRQLSARDSARFAALSWRATDDGAVRICGASAWLDCSIEQQIPAGDHDIVLLRVRDVGAADGEVPPLVFHGSSYRRLQPRCGDSDRAHGGDSDRVHSGDLDRARGEAPSRLRAG